MAPAAKDINDQQGLRRSSRSNFGKRDPSLHEGYVVGDAATRPALRHKIRLPMKRSAVDDDDEDEPASASSTPTTAGRAAKTRNKRRSGTFTSAADGDGELVSSSSPSASRRNSIVLDCIYVKLPPSMQMPPSPTGQTLQQYADSPIQHQQAMFPPVPVQLLAPPPPQQVQQAPLSSLPQVPNQAFAPDGGVSPLRDAGNQQAGRVDVDAMDLDLDMYLNLDMQDNEEVVDEEHPPRASPNTANNVDLDVDMTDLDDGFANVMQLYGKNSDEKIFQDRLAAQGRYSEHDGPPDELSARAMKPSAYSDVS